MGLRLVKLCLLAMLTAMAAGGCSKHSAPVATTSANLARQEDSNAVPVPAPSPHGPGPTSEPATAAVITDSGDTDATLRQLSVELRRYVVRSHSVPKTFEEFAAKSHVQMPPPPPGSKYAIQNQAVVLVKL
ncbi:MAG: hypothetical protein C5B50_11695 [Verrucomicrobia bacterium]|nr:MAG: hypothetical protein C5B50_11695 [Verrucomicrobiota bacterium]